MAGRGRWLLRPQAVLAPVHCAEPWRLVSAFRLGRGGDVPVTPGELVVCLSVGHPLTALRLISSPRIGSFLPHPLAVYSTIATPLLPFSTDLPNLKPVPDRHSNPIVHRVRRKRQRLPPSLLIENASDRVLSLRSRSCPEAFPAKASDHADIILRHG